MNQIVSLYSGCGGLDLGFHEAGFQTVLSIENNPQACASLELNRMSMNVICEDIAKIDEESARLSTGFTNRHRPALVIGGPPCPAYSKSRFYRKELPHGKDDPSFITIERYFDFVETFRPQMFVFENVHTFAAKRQQGALDYTLSRATKLGYRTDYRVLNAVNFGVPQKRERLFIVGCSDDLQFTFPDETHSDLSENASLFPARLPWVTAGDAIGDIDDPANNSQLPRHFAGGQHHDLLCEIPEGENYLFFTEKRGHQEPRFKWRSRYWSFLLKLSRDRPSWTIQARRSNNMGPFHWRNRILTIDEVKRLQTFPDDYELVGTTEQQWRQVGNAVPPVLATAIANQVAVALGHRAPIGQT